MDVLDILTAIFPKEIYQLIISYGVIYFILIYYGSNKWKNYSDFEKILFSVISGGVVWYFLVIPISFFLTTLRIFQNELPEIRVYDLFQYTPILYLAIFSYLLFFRFILSPKPLRDDKTFFEFTKILIISITIFLVAMNIIFLGLFFPKYPEYVIYPLYSIFSLFFGIGIFYLIFSEIYGVKIRINNFINALNPVKISDTYLIDALDEDIRFLKSKISIVIKNEIVWKALICCLILIIIGILGSYFGRTTTQIIEEKTERLVIDEMYIHPYYWQEVNISGYYQVEQNYSIKFGLIPWIKIRPNITLKDGYNMPKNPNYNFIYINNSWFNTTNIILRGIKEESNIPKFYTLKIRDLNETTQRWDIEFNNTYLYPIEIYYVNVFQPPELKYIKYVQSDGLSLNEVVMENSRIIIKRVTIHPESETINPNRSITLYFEKIQKV